MLEFLLFLSDPEISIIIPVFNGEQYLQYSLGSALKQNASLTEIILINDGSTDGTDKAFHAMIDK